MLTLPLLLLPTAAESNQTTFEPVVRLPVKFFQVKFFLGCGLFVFWEKKKNEKKRAGGRLCLLPLREPCTNCGGSRSLVIKLLPLASVAEPFCSGR